MPDINYGPISGDFGTAVPVVVPPVPEYGCLLMHWLITGNGFHPQRTQWVMAVNSLADHPNFVPAKLKFAGATHEFIIMPLDPLGGTQTPHSLMRLLMAHALPLLPLDAVSFQVQATNAEIGELIPVLAAAVVRQGWSPDVSGDPGNVRGGWREAVERNLAMVRGRPQPRPRPLQVPTPPGGTSLLTPATGTMTPPGGQRQNERPQ